MPEDKNKKQQPEPEPPKIIEQKDLEVELFSDEPDPWGP